MRIFGSKTFRTRPQVSFGTGKYRIGFSGTLSLVVHGLAGLFLFWALPSPVNRQSREEVLTVRIAPFGIPAVPEFSFLAPPERQFERQSSAPASSTRLPAASTAALLPQIQPQALKEAPPRAGKAPQIPSNLPGIAWDDLLIGEETAAESASETQREWQGTSAGRVGFEPELSIDPSLLPPGGLELKVDFTIAPLGGQAVAVNFAPTGSPELDRTLSDYFRRFSFESSFTEESYNLTLILRVLFKRPR